MLGTVEARILKMVVICKTIWEEGGFTALGLIVAAAILALPFLFVWGIFMAFVLEGVFKLLAITAVAPLLVVCAAFQPTRGFAISGARVVLGGILTVVLAAVAMGFTLSVLDIFIAKMPVGPSGFTTGIKEWVLSKDYWAAFILGFVSVLFHLKAATLASNISGASDGPGAAAAVVAGGTVAPAAGNGAGIGAFGRGQRHPPGPARGRGPARLANPDSILWRQPPRVASKSVP